MVCYIHVNDLVPAAVGSFDHPGDWPPDEHYGIKSQAPWLVIHDDLPRMRTDESSLLVAVQSAVEQGEGSHR